MAALEITEDRNGDPWFPPHKGEGLQVVRGYSNQPGWGEPLNVIISAHSDPFVLTDKGFEDFCATIGFSYEFMHMHRGPPMTANLGDGNDWTNQIVELRFNYGSRHLGTGLQTLIGGNHLRMWRQNGPKARTGALFLAVSMTEDLTKHHKTVHDGYNRGRDEFVQLAIAGGEKSKLGHRYETVFEHAEGLFCNNTYRFCHDVPQDDKVVVLKVTIKPPVDEPGIMDKVKSNLTSFLA